MSLVLYADDNQLVFAFSKKCNTNLGKFKEDLLAVSDWMAANCLQLNASKSEILLFGRDRELWSEQCWLDRLKPAPLPKVVVKNLGAWFDNGLTFDKQLKAVAGVCFGLLRGLKPLPGFLPPKVRQRIVQASILSRMYLFQGFSKKYLTIWKVDTLMVNLSSQDSITCGTSGGGASSDVIVIDSESEEYSVEDAAPADNQTVRKQAVAVASTVGNTKTAKPSRSMLAVLARQRRLDATVAQYRRLVEMEGDDTHSSASNVTSSASSSVTPRSAGKRSAPANQSRAGRRHRRAAKAAPPHSTVKARLRRALRRVSNLEAEVKKWEEYKKVMEGLRLDHAMLREEYDALALRHDALEAKVNNLHP
ncbi:uncharacterized protein LOC144782581 [Lissotriton helveticus]